MRPLSRWRSFVTFVFVLLGLAAGRLEADVLYDQPRLGSDAFMPGLNSNLNDQVIYDDFTLAGESEISGIQWTGVYQQTSVLTTSPVRFFIGLYADEGGLPGALLVGETVDLVGEQIGVTPNLKYPAFSYAVSLNNPLNRPAGAKTWVSVVESDTTTNVTWTWEFHDDLNGNKVAYQSGPGQPVQLSFNNYDVAFTVLGNVVPEPATWRLLSLGGLGLLVALRRRRGAAGS